MPALLVLRHHLAEIQWKSATAKVGARVLARYEILDSNCEVDFLSYGRIPPKDDRSGFIVLAALYWTECEPRSRMLSTIEHERIAEGFGLRTRGPTLTTLRVQYVTFAVTPNDCVVTGEGKRTTYERGKDGWSVSKPRLMKEFVHNLSPEQQSLPAYDISYQAVRSSR
jgi:hypothetical protein